MNKNLLPALILLFTLSCSPTATDNPNESEISQSNVPGITNIDSSVLKGTDTINTEAGKTEIIDYGLVVVSTDEVRYFIIELNNFTLEFRFETSLTIHGEGPHCDLADWKHGYTEWKNMTKYVDTAGCYFEIPEIPETIQNNFPELPFAEIKDRFRQHCGESWYKLISRSNSMKGTPVEVAVSRIIFRASGTRKDNGIKTSRIFSIYIPMGC